MAFHRATAAILSASWLDEIDPVAAVRGSSSGFTVLVIGGLLAPAIAVRVPVIGSLALVLTAIVGFATAAWRRARTSRPVLQGVVAAVGAYLLVLPIVAMTHHRWDPIQIGLTLLTAIVVGAVVGPIALRIGRIGSPDSR
jgi:mannose/fructose/N-acetylgalactosamine-specific phosphotransferase system component IID